MSAAIVLEAAASLAPEERMALEAAVPALERLRDALLARVSVQGAGDTDEVRLIT